MKIAKPTRTAVTLMELLVVIFIIGVIFALGIFLFPHFEQQSRVANGAVQLQGWLNVAKHRAQRDLVPHGLRLLPGPAATFKQVTECQYIEQPDSFSGGSLATSGNTSATIASADLIGGDPRFPLVQRGDFLEVLDSGLVHLISGIAQQGPQNFTLSLASSIGFPISNTTRYRIQRRPRVVGEETLKMPDSVIIDLATNDPANLGGFNNPLVRDVEGNVDILFAPNGQVIGSQTPAEQILLWVRDIDQKIQEGDPTLISVRTKTGLISAYPVDLTLNGAGQLAVPYAFAYEE